MGWGKRLFHLNCRQRDKGPCGQSESESDSVMSDFLQPHELYSPWNSPGQNTGVGSLSLLQGIFPTQGLNPGLPHCRQILYQLSHKGSPYKVIHILKNQLNVNCYNFYRKEHGNIRIMKSCFPLSRSSVINLTDTFTYLLNDSFQHCLD